MTKYLYLISQDINNDYDTYDSAVVVARSAAEARRILPGRGSEYEWCAPKYVKAKRVGIASPGLEGTICASFNAG